MLKYLNTTFLLHLLNLYVSAQERSFFIKGEFKNHTKEIIYLAYTPYKDINIKDSTVIINNKFSFTGTVKNPTIARFYVKENNIMKSTELWLEPGTLRVKIKGDEFTELKVSGSASHNEYCKLLTAKEKIKKKYKIQLDSLKGVRDMKIIVPMRERLAPYFVEMEKVEIDFFKRNPTSFITAYMLRFYTGSLPLDSLMLFYERMSLNVKNSLYGSYLLNEISKIKMGSPGNIASDFQSVTHTGLGLMLSSYKGKYVLLDFWASWCVPCRKEHPALIEMYEKYKSQGIEFIGIADDDERKETWVKAIQQDGLPWPQVLRGLQTDEITLKRTKENNDINGLYGIHSLPTLLLIDPAGMIIGRYEENINDLKNDLNKIFNKQHE